jgi:hypothetical protein
VRERLYRRKSVAYPEDLRQHFQVLGCHGQRSTLAATTSSEQGPRMSLEATAPWLAEERHVPREMLEELGLNRASVKVFRSSNAQLLLMPTR